MGKGNAGAPAKSKKADKAAKVIADLKAKEQAQQAQKKLAPTQKPAAAEKRLPAFKDLTEADVSKEEVPEPTGVESAPMDSAAGIAEDEPAALTAEESLTIAAEEPVAVAAEQAVANAPPEVSGDSSKPNVEPAPWYAFFMCVKSR